MEFITWNTDTSKDSSITVFQRRFKARRVALVTSRSVLLQCNLYLDPEGNLGPVQQGLEKHLEVLFEGKPTLTTTTMPDGRTVSQKSWKVGTRSLIVMPNKDGLIALLIIEQMQPATTTAVKVARAVINVDLDALVDMSQLWTWTPQMLEQKYVAQVEENQEKVPEFQWLSATKDRARFSRKAFADVDTRLTMFGKSLNVEEAVVEFVKGRAARVTLSFYNRGDSGNIKGADFMNTFKTVGKNLGQILKVAPSNQSAVASTAIKTVSWQWKSPSGIALLEHNDYASAGGQPEYLRAKLAAPDQANWSMGKLAVGVQRMALLDNITKTSEGDVYIARVPMVDQGAKGYCVAASCQRLLEYMHIPCDQHEIAQLVNADAESGANIFAMQKSLAKIDGQFKVTFKPHINPEFYYSSGRRRRVSQRQFSLIVQEHVNKGVPLLWALELGRFPEVPPLPGDGQMNGGHMRMVIGYNTTKKEILFTDSWGAGHELKRMSEADAYEVTLGLYSMSPRGL